MDLIISETDDDDEREYIATDGMFKVGVVCKKGASKRDDGVEGDPEKDHIRIMLFSESTNTTDGITTFVPVTKALHLATTRQRSKSASSLAPPSYSIVDINRYGVLMSTCTGFPTVIGKKKTGFTFVSEVKMKDDSVQAVLKCECAQHEDGETEEAEGS